MNPTIQRVQNQTRRHFLQHSSAGLGSIALAGLMADQAGAASASQDPLAVRKPHFQAKAKRVIYLHMTGSPPNLDLFDYKPELTKRDDQDCPDQFIEGKTFAFTSGKPKLLASPRKWQQVGSNGMWMSDAIPNLHGIADD